MASKPVDANIFNGREMISPRVKLPIEQIGRLYLNGVSEKRIAELFNTNRQVIRRRLLHLGIRPRNRSESMYIRMSQTSKEERQRLTNSAHDAVRGSSKSLGSKIKHAKTIEKISLYGSPAEALLREWLYQRGISLIIPQRACGIYNIDLAIFESIAVELHGGHWHTCKSHILREPKRVMYLLDQGWHVLTIWYNGISRPLTEGAADYIVAFFKELSCNKSMRRQYRVIWGNGNDASIKRLNIN